MSENKFIYAKVYDNPMNKVMVNGKFLSEKEWDEIYQQVKEKHQQLIEKENNPPACPSDYECSFINSFLDMSLEKEERNKKEKIRRLKNDIKLFNLLILRKRDEMSKQLILVQENFKKERKKFDDLIEEYTLEIKQLEL